MFRAALLFAVCQGGWLPMPRPVETPEPAILPGTRKPCECGYVVGKRAEPWHTESELYVGPDGYYHARKVMCPQCWKVRLCDDSDQPRWHNVPEAVYERLKLGQWFDPRSVK